MVTEGHKIIIVDQSNWRRDELSAQKIIEVKHSYGIDIPTHNKEDIWWIPQGWACRVNNSLIAHNMPLLRLTSPGAYLLPSTPPEALRRSVEAVTAYNAWSNPREGWWKMAEAKSDKFIAKFRTIPELIKDINNAELPSESLLHYTSTTLPILEEYRSFIKEGKVLTTSIYLSNTNGQTRTIHDSPLVNEPKVLKKVKEFLEKILTKIESPAGFVADTALLEDGSLVVLEYNPSWCSGWYECELTGVIKSIEASFSNYPNWAWVPDSSLQEIYSKQRPLPLA